MRVIRLSEVEDYELLAVPALQETPHGPMWTSCNRLTIGDEHYDQVDGFQFIDIQTGDIVLVLPAWNSAPAQSDFLD